MNDEIPVSVGNVCSWWSSGRCACHHNSKNWVWWVCISAPTQFSHSLYECDTKLTIQGFLIVLQFAPACMCVCLYACMLCSLYACLCVFVVVVGGKYGCMQCYVQAMFMCVCVFVQVHLMSRCQLVCLYVCKADAEGR